MRLDRLREGELLAGAGGALLLVAMFLPWFGKVSPFCTPYPGYSCGRNYSAWSIFGFTDYLLLLTALAGIGVAVAGTYSKTDSQITSASLTTPLAFLVTLLVAYRVVDPVGKLDLRFGIYIGLLGCLAVTYGGWRAVRNDGPSRVRRPDPPRPASQRRSPSSSDSRPPRSGKARRRRRTGSRPR